MKARWQELKIAAHAARRSGDLASAQRLMLEAVDQARSFGEHDPDLAGTINALADLHRAQGNLGEAARTAREGLELRRRAGHAEILVGNDLMFLAAILEAQGDRASAAPLAEEALDLYGRALGTDHPEVGYVKSVLRKLLLERSGGDLR
jgi:tetratricopeptide (TPR) repeat protein